jgi:hypothetical protein
MISRMIDYFMGVCASMFVICFATAVWWVWCAWEAANGVYPGALWVNFNNLILRIVF